MRPHPRARLNNSGQLIDREERFFHICQGLNIGADAPAVAHNRAHIFFVNALGEQFFFGMLKMLIGEFLIIIIVKIADGHPVFAVLAEIIGHRAHGIHYIFRVYDEVIFLHLAVIEFAGFFKCKHSCLFPSGFFQ